MAAVAIALSDDDDDAQDVAPEGLGTVRFVSMYWMGLDPMTVDELKRLVCYTREALDAEQDRLNWLAVWQRDPVRRYMHMGRERVELPYWMDQARTQPAKCSGETIECCIDYARHMQ